MPFIMRSTLLMLAEQVAAQLKAHWSERPGDGVLRRGRVEIDLRTVQGRCEMLAFTVLSAAKVSNENAETTFLALRDEGLLDRERLYAADPDDRRRTVEILRAKYRARIRKEAKAEALFSNQRLLDDEWGGDLNHIYQMWGNEPVELIRALQRFAQIRQRAHWLCREMAAAGVWTHLPPSVTAYVDPMVGLPLVRLALVEVAGDQTWERLRDAWQAAIDRLFAGDVIPLVRHAFEYCRKEDERVCRTMCTVRYACRYRNEAQNTVGAVRLH